MRNLFRFNNKDTRKTSLRSIMCLYCQLWTCANTWFWCFHFWFWTSKYELKGQMLWNVSHDFNTSRNFIGVLLADWCLIKANFHCVKNVHIRVFFWSVFYRTPAEYWKIRTRKNSVFWHYSRSEYDWLLFNENIELKCKKEWNSSN